MSGDMLDHHEPDTKTSGLSLDPRHLAAWQEWLAKLATDAEAAMAATHVYGELGPEARNAWLDALAEDVPKLSVPAVAIYAPLLGVESDEIRRARIEQALGDMSPTLGPVRGLALRGVSKQGERIVALITPLFLHFVRVLWCRYRPNEGILWAEHEPILPLEDAPSPGVCLDDVALEATPVKPVIEELCHAVLAQRRKGAALPVSLHLCVDIFNAQLDSDTLL